MADKVLIDRAVVEQALEALENCSSEYGHRCNRCDSEVDEGGKVASALRAALAQAEPVQSAAGVDAYDMIDRFLRNNLQDDDYAEYSAALDSLYTAPQQAEPVAFDPADAERDALRSLINNVLRCRYPVCTTICSSGYGWDIPRLNEVIDAAKGGGNG